MLDPKNVSFDKLNKPSLCANARCTIVETVLREHEKTQPLTAEQKQLVLDFGMAVVNEVQRTMHRILDGEATLINGTGEFDDTQQLTACYANRRDDSEISIGRRVSKPNSDGMCITGSLLTIV